VQMIKLRIHHLFDMLRDYGAEKEITPHPYGHSYHIISQQLFSQENIELILVNRNDDVCINCSKSQRGHCIDTISHRNDFPEKEDFNNYLDSRIMQIMDLQENEIISLEKLLDKSKLYIDMIQWIYKGNEFEHTETRKENVIQGLIKLNQG
jgi:hypothetical protein